MNETYFSRTELLVGQQGMQKLAQTSVAVIGLGGVGSYSAEALARSGIGKLILIDFDVIEPTNINRQILALQSNIGKPKVELMQQRILDINRKAEVIIYQEVLDENKQDSLLARAEYCVDAIDSLSAKISLLEFLLKNERKFISVMGAGNRLDPSQVHISTIDKSYNCPLARKVRKLLSKRGIKGSFPCVYSSELPLKIAEDNEVTEAEDLLQAKQRRVIGSISYLPSIMGLMAASYVIRDVLKD
ncbi:MAG TPA: tRNA threonylcarbamoyladenosine dehydratase [Candidatus Cloacimonas sp.]|nr:tRNA threonylcarbamoyladenosine dehydratase [Candidatus Cloacimonas sp.]